MLKLTWIEFFLRTIPEIFILIWGIHVISRKSIRYAQIYIFKYSIGYTKLFCKVASYIFWSTYDN